MNIKEISEKFRGYFAGISRKFQKNFIKNNNQRIHIHSNPWPEIQGGPKVGEQYAQ